MASLRVPPFAFDSALTSTAFDLERLRGDLPRTADAMPVIRELGELYRLVNSIVSARIEGNHTTILDAVEGAARSERSAGAALGEGALEIVKLQEASDYIDRTIGSDTPLTHTLVRELHHLATSDLDREGDTTPGAYRRTRVTISQSRHVPPEPFEIQPLMDELLEFANDDAEPHMQLVRMAVAHHRFVWIHPFSNGNGRVARLFSYAVLRRYAFAPDLECQTINPTTVFGGDRPGYYERLADADSMSDDALVRWCSYVLEGLKRDMESMLILASGGTLATIVAAAADAALRAGQVTAEEAAVLRHTADGTPFKSGDLTRILSANASARSRVIIAMRDKLLIRPESSGGRIYRIRLAPNPVTPFLVGTLDERGFLPEILGD